MLPGESLRVWVAKSIEEDRQRSHGRGLRGPKVVGGGLPGPLRAVQRAVQGGQEQALPESRPQTITDEAHSRGRVPCLSMPPFHHPEHAIITESASQALRVK